MTDRHRKIGIKQTIQKEWMDRTVRMMLAGLTETEIRVELDQYLATQKPSGGTGVRGQQTYGMAIAVLASWFAPNRELCAFVDDAKKLAKIISQDQWLPLHWAVISASYPFWFNAAKQVGRLLNLQDQVTQLQIFNRLKEQYGDRETVARNARYAVRSLIAWGVLNDTSVKGAYTKSNQITVHETEVAILLYEAALLTLEGNKSPLAVLTSNPAFFPFLIPPLSGEVISQRNRRIEVTRYGLDDELLQRKQQ